MPTRPFTILATAVLCLATPPVHAQEDDPAALARRLLAVSGSANLGEQVMEQMIGQMRQAAAPGSVPDEFWENLPERYDAGGLVERIVPIYTERLSADEMKAAIAFYTSEHGRTIIDKMPTIMTESMMASREWGMAVAGDIMQEIQDMAPEAAGTGESEPAPGETAPGP